MSGEYLDAFIESMVYQALKRHHASGFTEKKCREVAAKYSKDFEFTINDDIDQYAKLLIESLKEAESESSDPKMISRTVRFHIKQYFDIY
jgi:hypothetical protein